jgi:myo-inositol-1(or 4)-monophosphatase
MAAGNALVREAGGVVTDLHGGNDMLKTGGIVVGNADIHRELLNVLLSAVSP